MPEQVHPRKLYLVTYVALLALLALTILFSFVPVSRGYNDAIAIGIACAKGLLIILFFMHVRSQPWVTWFFAGAGFLWLGILLTLSVSEYVGRNHPRDGGPKGEPRFLSPSLGQTHPGGRVLQG